MKIIEFRLFVYTHRQTEKQTDNDIGKYGKEAELASIKRIITSSDFQFSYPPLKRK